MLAKLEAGSSLDVGSRLVNIFGLGWMYSQWEVCRNLLRGVTGMFVGLAPFAGK